MPRAERDHPLVLSRRLDEDRATVCPEVLVPSGQGIADGLELGADLTLLADRLGCLRWLNAAEW